MQHIGTKNIIIIRMKPKNRKTHEKHEKQTCTNQIEITSHIAVAVDSQPDISLTIKVVVRVSFRSESCWFYYNIF